MADQYRVDGMTCGGCARSVSNAITRAAPEATVTVDLEAKIITVTGAVAADVVKKAVETAGFSFHGPA